MIHKIAKRVTKSLGFKPDTLSPFLVTAIGSQTIFSFFAIRSVLYNPLIETLGVTNTQFGILMSLTGVGTVFAAVLGFLQNRLSWPSTACGSAAKCCAVGAVLVRSGNADPSSPTARPACGRGKERSCISASQRISNSNSRGKQYRNRNRRSSITVSSIWTSKPRAETPSLFLS